MAQRREIGARAAADLVLRLSRAALGEGFVEVSDISTCETDLAA